MSAYHRVAILAKLGLLSAGLLLSACGDTQADGAVVEQVGAPPVVEIVSVLESGEAAIVRATGQTVYKREAALGFGSPGEIMSIRVDEGDRVKRGQLLATLRRINVGADAAEADLARETAQKNYDRLKQLHESGAVSDLSLEEARLTLERTRQNLSIHAPREGVVLRRAVERGQIVSAGAPVVVIGEANGGVVAEVSLNASQMTRIKQGDYADVMVRERGRFDGEITRISPTGSTSGLFQIEITLKTDQALRAGEVVEASIFGAAAQDAGRMIIPAIALVDARADQGAVFIVDEEMMVHRRSVETSGLDRDGVIVNQGLTPGDRIVTRGASLLRDGQLVRVLTAEE